MVNSLDGNEGEYLIDRWWNGQKSVWLLKGISSLPKVIVNSISCNFNDFKNQISVRPICGAAA
jgi:hypothetical protein